MRTNCSFSPVKPSDFCGRTEKRLPGSGSPSRYPSQKRPFLSGLSEKECKNFRAKRQHHPPEKERPCHQRKPSFQAASGQKPDGGPSAVLEGMDKEEFKSRLYEKIHLPDQKKAQNHPCGFHKKVKNLILSLYNIYLFFQDIISPGTTVCVLKTRAMFYFASFAPNTAKPHERARYLLE